MGCEVSLNHLQGLIETQIGVNRADKGLIGIGKNRGFLPSATQEFPFPQEEVLVQMKDPCKGSEGGPLHQMGPHLGEHPFVSPRKFLEKIVAHGEVENGIAEEFQDFICPFSGRLRLISKRPVDHSLIEPVDVLKPEAQTLFELTQGTQTTFIHSVSHLVGRARPNQAAPLPGQAVPD